MPNGFSRKGFSGEWMNGRFMGEANLWSCPSCWVLSVNHSTMGISKESKEKDNYVGKNTKLVQRIFGRKHPHHQQRPFFTTWPDLP